MAKQKKTSVHKSTPNPARKNGKAFKQHPQIFSKVLRRLVTGKHVPDNENY